MSLWKSRFDTSECRCLLVSECLPGYLPNRRSSSLRQLLAAREFSHEESDSSDLDNESALTQVQKDLVPFAASDGGGERRRTLQCLNIYTAGKLVCKTKESCCSSSARSSCQRKGRYYRWIETSCTCQEYNHSKCAPGDSPYRCCSHTGLRPRKGRRALLAHDERPMRSLLHRRCEKVPSYSNTYRIPNIHRSGCGNYCCGKVSYTGKRKCNDDDDR